MPYNVNYTNTDRLPITVNDSTNNTETSLTFPGRNQTGYGQYIAENFLRLLENFANDDTNEPVNPTEGQLWFNTSNKTLLIYDGTSWKAASNIQKSNVQPSIELAQTGELWVDTNNQQLYVFSGSRWILVGPQFSTGLRSGPLVEEIVDSTNETRVVVTFYVEDEPMSIISKDSFTPKVSIAGFPIIKSGVNITSITDVGTGGLAPKFYGSSLNSDSLNIAGSEIAAAKFLRSDTVNTTEQSFNVRNNQGITIGVDGTFSLSVSSTASKIYNSAPGSSIDFQTNQDGIPVTVLRVIENKIGINKAVPDEALDISGNIKSDSSIILTGTTESTNFGNGTLRTAGGIAVSKNILVGTTLSVTGTTTTANIRPAATDTYTLGSSTTNRYRSVYVKDMFAENIYGVLDGNITGNAQTATNLKFETLFRTTGAITSAAKVFTGTEGSITLETTLTSEIISGQTLAPTARYPDDRNDQLIIFRSTASTPGGPTGLFKVAKENLLQDFGVPLGAVFPFAGTVIPFGYLLCDGREIEISKYPRLHDIIGTTYGITSIGFNTFKLPDLRGRFALGRDNMNNKTDGVIAGIVPTVLGGTAEGLIPGPAGRVDGVEAQTLGSGSGSSSKALEIKNLPNHEHTLQGSSGQQYYATRPSSGAPSDTGSFSEKGPTTPGQMQYLPSSGGIKTSETLSSAFSVMNPFLTINYIIRSGPPVFED
jgi:microcystin-dependent protein